MTRRPDPSRWSRCPDCREMIDVHPLIHQILEHAPRIGARASGIDRSWRTAKLLAPLRRSGPLGINPRMIP